jgi:hypothetical protein
MIRQCHIGVASVRFSAKLDIPRTSARLRILYLRDKAAVRNAQEWPAGLKRRQDLP